MLLHHGAMETYRDNTGRTAFRYAPEGAQVDEKEFGETRENVDIEAVSKNEEVVNAIHCLLLGAPRTGLPSFRARSFSGRWLQRRTGRDRGPWKLYPICARRIDHEKPFSFMMTVSRYNLHSRAATCRVETQRHRLCRLVVGEVGMPFKGRRQRSVTLYDDEKSMKILDTD